ncbi:MAG: DUF1801 domain-containing protein [Marinicella pacifica]
MNDLISVSPNKAEMVASIRALFLSANKTLTEDIKYGGLVFKLNNELIGGVFPYKNHISIEFSHGVDLADPDGLLEGKGKFRRHVKMIKKQDIESKNVAAFVAEAVKN